MALNFLDIMKRNFNLLKDGDMKEKKQAVTTIYDSFIQNNEEIDDDMYEDLMKLYLKILLENLSYKSDQVREFSCKIINLVLQKCQRLHVYVPYIVLQLVEKTNCQDLDNMQDLPEDQRPTPSKKPHVVKKLKEFVEEIRLQYVYIVQTIVDCAEEEIIIQFLQEIVNIIRTFLMDPFQKVQIEGCNLLSNFINQYKKYLISFNAVIMRALLTPLVSKKMIVRKVAFKPLKELLYIGSFQKSYLVMEILVGYQDPNYVAIKDFYNPEFNYNYLAMFVKDPKIQVRQEFYEMLEDWIMSLPDIEEHLLRILPYLLSGLSDESETIQEQVVEVLEQMGKKVEREKEKKFREEIQLGIQPFWSKEGQLLDKCILKPFDKRPRMGTRFYIQKHASKYVNSIMRELKESMNFENKLKALKLLKQLIYMQEENSVEFASQIIRTCTLLLKQDFKSQFKKEIQQIMILLGRYNEFKNVFQLFTDYIHQEQDYLSSQIELLSCFAKGYFSFIDTSSGLCEKYCDFVQLLQYTDDNLIQYEYKNIQILIDIVSEIQHKYMNQNEKTLIEQKLPISLFRMNMYQLIFQQQKNNLSQEIKSLWLQKVDLQIGLESFDYKILIYLSKNETEIQYLERFLNILEDNNELNKNSCQQFLDILQTTLVNENIQRDEQFLLILQNFCVKYLEKNDIKIRNEEQLIKVLKIYLQNLSKIKETKNMTIYNENLKKILQQYINIFKNKIDRTDMVIFLELFQQIIKCLHFISKHDIYIIKSCYELYLNKYILFTKELQQQENSISILALIIMKCNEQHLTKEELNKSFEKILKIYWNQENQLIKQRIMDVLQANFKKHKDTLSILILNAEKEQRINRLEFLKDIWIKIKQQFV